MSPPNSDSAVEELLARFVAIDTTSDRSPSELLELLAELLDGPGVGIRRLPYPEDGKWNLLARIGPEADPGTREGLVLSGHVDVVPAGGGWSSDPFRLTRRNGRLVGRGTADMKGFLALAVAMARRLDPSDLRAPLDLLFTVDEEVGTLGARYLAELWPEDEILPRRAIVGEPTELVAVPRHKGHLKVRVTVHGENAHTAYPHLGRNAIEPAAELVRAWVEVADEMREERLPSSDHFPDVPHPTLTVATIRGGTAINVVPDRCVVEAGVRLLPGMDPDEVAERVRSAALATLEGEEWEWEVLSVSPPMESSPEADVVAALHELGVPSRPSVGYTTDAGWIEKLGVDCVIWGPGSISVAHKPDEWLPAEDLVEAAPVLEAMVERFCR